ncbi:MAG: ABC transporter permease [Aphanocapsa sp. GSE-SYN-MK-11-07L]|jgi:hypothetical protein|nr:ABC transporter permease [Aphanocapsa sp. GSE-SYN-MK-11-07L]
MQQPQQAPWIDQLGDWNPQLLRELRGRLKPRSVIAAIALSAIGQLLLFLIIDKLPNQSKWLNIWRSFTYGLPFLLLILGSYLIVSDLTHEENRGTLNFIRLSPRPAWQILLGKILGVPTLLYLAIVLAIPLHLIAAVAAGLPSELTLSFYLLLLASCILCYSAAMLYSLIAVPKPGAASWQFTAGISFVAIAFSLGFVIAFYFWSFTVAWRSLDNFPEIFGYSLADQRFWFYLDISQNFWLAHAFTLINLAIGTALIWRVLLRYFRQPRSSVLSKKQASELPDCSLSRSVFLGLLALPRFGRESP